MKILILHKIAYPKIDYHRGIDHERHEVTYIGTAEKLATVPADLRCRKLAREDRGEEVCGSVLAALGGERDFDRVISLSEYDIVEAAKVREALGVAGPSYADAQLVRDKVAMKRAVVAAGIDAPRFLSLAGFDDGVATMTWAARTVLKPTHGAGSEDVVIFATAADALAALAERRTGVAKLEGATPAFGSYELEEFVDGPIVHLDGLVREGRVEVAIGSRYIGTCQRYNENVPLGSYQFDLDAPTMAWIQRVITATRIQMGAFHLEAIESERGLVFLEIGNRTGGAGVPQATSIAWGDDFQKLELELLVGECQTDLRALGNEGRYCGWYVLPGHRYGQGQWLPTGAVDRLRQDPRAVEWHERPPSDGFDSSPDYDLGSLPFAGVVSAASSELARDYMMELFEAMEWRERGAMPRHASLLAVQS